MRIGIFAQPLANPQPTGIAGYTRGLIDALASLDNDTEILLYYEYNKQNHQLLGFENTPRVKKRGVRFPGIHEHPRWWWNCCLPTLLRLDRINVFHGPNHCVPSFGPPSVCTIHDLAYYHMKVAGRGLDGYLKRWTEKSMQRSSAIITVSRSTAADCISAGVPEEKIRTIYQGFTTPNGSTRNLNQDFPAERHLIRRGYYLFVGTLQPRKNIPHLVNEYGKIASKVSWDLVIAGASGPDHSKVLSLIKKNKLENRVHLLGFVSDDQRQALFLHASSFVYPSKYEGFGLPILEAMAMGVPVIASNNSSLPEAVGDAGILADTSTAGSLSEDMLEMYHNQAMRDHLIQQGYAHVTKFTWRRCAEETLAVYKSLNASKRSSTS